MFSEIWISEVKLKLSSLYPLIRVKADVSTGDLGVRVTG